MVFYEGKRGIPHLPVLQKSLIIELNEWVNFHPSSALNIHCGMALTREIHSYGQFATATPEEIQRLWNNVDTIHPMLVFNPATGTYPTTPQCEIQIQRRLCATHLTSLRSRIVCDQDHLFPREHLRFQIVRIPTMNPCELPRPPPQRTDIENLARMILTFRRQFRYTWEQVAEFLRTVGFAETRTGEVMALFEKYEHNGTMGSMHGLYETPGIIESKEQSDLPFDGFVNAPFARPTARQTREVGNQQPYNPHFPTEGMGRRTSYDSTYGSISGPITPPYRRGLAREEPKGKAREQTLTSTSAYHNSFPASTRKRPTQ